MHLTHQLEVMIMSNIEELANALATLKAEKNYQDREIKELKEKVEVLTTAFNGQALAIQDIKTDVRYMRDEFSSIKVFIENLKTQPQKALNKYIGWILSAIFGGACYIIGSYFKK